jgi:hypothetical protein
MSDDFSNLSPEEQQEILEAKDKGAKLASSFDMSPTAQWRELIEEISATKPAVNRSVKKVGSKKAAYLKKTEGSTASGRGMYNEESIEATPVRIAAGAEKTVNKGNSSIVLGRDRPGSRKSGYGGLGDTGAASIDMCVGPQGADARETHPETGEPMMVDPDFTKDAARIYMSQKTDVDHNFGLCEGSVGCPPARSAVGIKADGVRVVAREGIKLVTSTDRKNAQGALVDSAGGIDLIAGNDDRDLQPLVKGDSLAKALSELSDVVNDLNGILLTFLDMQMKFNDAVTNHTHNSPFFAAPTTPAITLLPIGMATQMKFLITALPDLQKHKANLKGFNANYCLPAGKSYICSRKNKTN